MIFTYVYSTTCWEARILKSPKKGPGATPERSREGPLFDVSLIINGAAVPGANDATYERRDPLSDTVVTRAAAASLHDAQQAANAAAAAFEDWASLKGTQRADILRQAAKLFAERVDDVVQIATDEIGSTKEWTRFNVELAIQTLEQAAELATDPELNEHTVENPNADVEYFVRRRPAGVVLGIAPWNAAVTLATRAVAAPLACGNTIVLKASELCPKTHEWVVRALNDAGLPNGVLNFITNAPENAGEIVESLIGHPAVRRVNFTGSTRVGRDIAQVAARYLKPCLLELSGKGTMIVLSDADLEEAAKAATYSAFFNQGQICMSTERVVVEEDVADEFVAHFVAHTTKLTAPNEQTQIGQLISPQAVLRVRGIVEDALAKGATLLSGGEVINTTMQPTILDHISPDMRIYSEEAFGPIAVIIRVADAEEALSVANDTEFGLVASVFTSDLEKGAEIARNFETGVSHVNGPTVFDDPRMPYGGVKASGYGRFGGREAIHEFTELQWITIRSNEQNT